MPQPIVAYLDTDDAEQKIADRHGVMIDDVYDMFERENWVVIRSKGKHPPERKRFVGVTPGGHLLTVILAPMSEPDAWKVVSAWWSITEDIRLYDEGMRH